MLLLSDLSDAEFSELLTDLNVSLKAEGAWNNEAAKARIADWAMAVDLYICFYGPGNCWHMPTIDGCAGGFFVNSCSEHSMYYEIIRNNILAWGLSETVPDIRQHIFKNRLKLFFQQQLLYFMSKFNFFLLKHI